MCGGGSLSIDTAGVERHRWCGGRYACGALEVEAPTFGEKKQLLEWLEERAAIAATSIIRIA